MSIEIKEGCYYRDRMGQVHGPMICHTEIGHLPWTTKQGMHTWTAGGCIYSVGESQNDLIEEVRIVPVDDEVGDT